MKTLPRTFMLISVILAAALLGGCVDMLKGPSAGAGAPELSGSAGRALVTIGPRGGAARTLMPAAAGGYYEGLTYTFEFTSSGKTPVAGGITEGTGTVILEAGTWDLTVLGKDSGGTGILQGTAQGVVITAGEETGVQVAMAAFTGAGAGTLTYDVTFPDDVTRGTLTVYRWDDDAVQDTAVDLVGTGTTAGSTITAAGTFSTTLAAGYYRVALDLFKADGVFHGTEIAHIYPGMTTAADYTMGAGDFTPAVVDDSQATFAGVMGTIAGLSGGANKVYLLSAGTETMAAAGVSNANGPVTVTVDGGGRVVELTTEIGSLITVGSNVTLVLRNITLQRGAGSNNVALVIVDNGGKLELEEGARITGNISYSNSFDTSGGGVYIASGGIFTMTGGEISGNGAYYGGGVYIATGGIFTMSGGAIAGNTAFHTTSSSFYYAYGGGVYVGPGGIFTMNGGEIADNEVGARYPYGGGVSVSGTFTMYGGKISGNMVRAHYLAQNLGNDAHGGGVFVHSSGTFTMYGGEISDNNVTGYDYVRRVEGGGVYAEGAFIMSGGKISGNTASVTSYYSYLTPVYGGGVFVTSSGTFTMSGGEISGNAVSGQEKVSSVDGGGVYTDGAFTMSGGEISGNTASYSNSSTAHTSGGGVFVNNSGTFTMSGGEISGNTTANYGGGVFVNSSGTFTMSGGAVNGNILPNTEGYGKEVLVAGTGTFTMSAAARPGRVFLANYDQSVTISGPLNGPVTPIDLGITGSVPLTRYLAVPILKLDSSYSGGDLASLKTHFTLGNSKMTDSPYTEEAIPGFYSINDGGLFIHLSINIKDIIYSDQWGGAWTLESDGRRRSPLIGHNGRTTMRVSFTSTVANAVIAIRLDVSSEANYDFAFITYLDRDSGSGSYDRISGGTGKVVTIPVPTAGSHFVEIVYDKNYSTSAGSDRAWFRIE